MPKLNRCGWGRCKRREPGASSSDEVDEFNTLAARRRVATPRTANATPFPELRSEQLLQRYLNDFTPSSFLRTKPYFETRDALVDSDEVKTWSHNSVRVLVEGTREEIRNNLRTPIRRGVPDALKRWVLRASHDCHEFLISHPSYVAKTYLTVFGTKVPDFSDGVVPTFSGGFIGSEADLHEGLTPANEHVDAAEAPKPFLHRGLGSRQSLMRSSSWSNIADVLSLPQGAMTTRNSIVRRPSQSLEVAPQSPASHEVIQSVLYTDYHNKQIKEHTVGSSSLMPPAPSSRALHALLHASSGALSAAQTLHQATYLANLLTANGQTIAKKILWTVNWIYPHLDFAPILPTLVCFLLLYLEEDDALVTVLKLLEASNELLKNNARRPFLTFRRSEFVRLVHMAMAFCKRTLPAIASHLGAIGVDLGAWFARVLEDGFSKTLPFNLFLRIVVPFFYEGTKVFLRYSLALLKMVEDQLLSATCADEVNFILLFREYRDCSPEMLNDLTKLAFRFEIRTTNEPLSKFSSHDLPTPYLTRTKVQKLYRPRLEEHSDIVSDDMWETIWRWIPAKERILDPELVFTLKKHGHSLKAMARYIWDDINRPMIFMVKTDRDDIIGGYSPHPFVRSDTVQSSAIHDLSGTFVFTLKPHVTVHRYSGATVGIMDFTFEHLMFGQQDAAIMIDPDLNYGHSGPSKTFSSPCLVQSKTGDFSVLQFEIWLLG